MLFRSTPKLVRYTPPPPEAPEQLTKQGPSVIKAPLPGTIIDIKVQRGQQVRREQTLIVLEAMKMENNILAEKDGVVKSITVSSGSTVMQGDILMEIE